MNENTENVAKCLILKLSMREKELGQKKVIHVSRQEFKEYRRLKLVKKFIFGV